MAGKDALQLVIPPEVQDAVLIDSEIDNLRKSILSDCSALLKEAKAIETSVHGKAFHIKLWEEQVAAVRRQQSATFSINRLKELKNQCRAMSQQLQRFRQ
ncbi:hypothetical protein H0O00_02380 [Candidatus Micrarchaeota archaeon]|nr:hypothetical protein [Candidatus Micrarchaeota archaeon]